MKTLEPEKEFSPTRKVTHISQLCSLGSGRGGQSSLWEHPASCARTAGASLPLQGCWDSVQLGLRARVCPEGEKHPWRSAVCPLVPHSHTQHPFLYCSPTSFLRAAMVKSTALQQPCCPTRPVPHAQTPLRCIYLRSWEMGMEPCCWQSWVQGELCPQTSHEQLWEQTPSVGWWGSTSSSPFCLGYKCFAE